MSEFDNNNDNDTEKSGKQMIQEVVAILDRSGSMAGKEDDSIGGINTAIETLKSQREKDTIIKVSIKLFDDREDMLIRSLDINEVRPIERRQFVPRGTTALLDAIGKTLAYFMEKKLIDQTAYDSCIIYVVTDGYENASTTFTSKKIKNMITNAENTYNIKLIYLAANQDAILEATNLGIPSTQAMNYSENTENVTCAYRSLANMAKRCRSGDCSGFTQEERNDSYV